MKFKKVQGLLLAVVLSCSMVATPVFAAPKSAEQSSLEAQKAETQSEVSSLQDQLNSLMTKMNDLETQLIEKGQQISQAEVDLEAAQQKEQQQYEDLKLRIKYMYEEGDGSAMERILTSGSIAEVLTQAEYVQKVHSYDREQLQEYQNTVQQVADLKDGLEEDQAKLQNLEGEYQAQSDELNSTIESKSAEISNLDSMIQEAARVALEKAAAEKAAAEQKAAEKAAQSNAASNTTVASNATSNTTNNNVSNNTNTGGSTDTGNSGGTTIVTPDPTPDPTPVTPSTPSTPSASVDGGSVVSRAYSQLGAAYVWGACSPGAFDCSGFVSYCLTGSYTRLGTTYTFLGWTQVSDPQPGDVCVNANHCGIYIGGGQMIHAATEGVGVIVGAVQSGMIYVRY